MLERIGGVGGLVGVLILIGGLVLIGLHSLQVAAGLGLVLAGLVLVLRGVVQGVLSSMGMGGML